MAVQAPPEEWDTGAPRAALATTKLSTMNCQGQEATEGPCGVEIFPEAAGEEPAGRIATRQGVVLHHSVAVTVALTTLSVQMERSTQAGAAEEAEVGPGTVGAVAVDSSSFAQPRQ